MKKYMFCLLALLVFCAGVFDLNAENARSRPGWQTGKKADTGRRSFKRPEKKVMYCWSLRNLERHFRKHRRAFPEYKSIREYGEGALKFFREPPAGTKFKRRSNGDRLFYHEKSNFFGVTTKDGVIKTFFRPNRGIRYWNRQ